MILNIHSDAAYLVAPYAQSRIGGYFYLSSNPSATMLHNAPIQIECKILRHVLTSSAECETTAVFDNTQKAIPTCYMLQQLVYSLLPTPIILDNSTTDDNIKNNMAQKRFKSWDLSYYWLRDQNILKKFNFTEKITT